MRAALLRSTLLAVALSLGLMLAPALAWLALGTARRDLARDLLTPEVLVPLTLVMIALLVVGVWLVVRDQARRTQPPHWVHWSIRSIFSRHSVGVQPKAFFV